MQQLLREISKTPKKLFSKLSIVGMPLYEQATPHVCKMGIIKIDSPVPEVRNAHAHDSLLI
jgi:hypothetical protein